MALPYENISVHLFSPSRSMIIEHCTVLEGANQMRPSHLNQHIFILTKRALCILQSDSITIGYSDLRRFTTAETWLIKQVFVS